MARIVKSFRIEQEIWDRLEARSGNTSELVRLFIVTGLFKMELPRQTEIEKLCVIEDQTRRIGVNLNQAVKGSERFLRPPERFTGNPASLHGYTLFAAGGS